MRVQFIYCFIFLLTSSVLSQPRSGEVVYNLHKTESFEQNELLKDYKKVTKKIDIILSDLSFKLKFNLTKSEFGIVKSLFRDIDEFHTKMAIITCRGNVNYFTDSKKQKIIELKPLFNKTYLIESTFKDYSWILTKESKKIGNYICYKARAQKEISGPGSVQKIKKNLSIIVWYCPELSFPYGPFESSGLPGLVLEYNIGSLVFIANSIKLSEKNISIELPKDGDGIKISKKEFDQIGKEAYENSKSFRN